MALTFYKNLIGRIDLTVAGNYQFVLPSPLKGTLPNALDNQVIEEVYIICNCADPINILLPSTTLFNDAWNAKIYVTNLGAGKVSIAPFQGSVDPVVLPDTLNGDGGSYTLGGQYESVFLKIVSDYMWIKLVCPAPLI